MEILYFYIRRKCRENIESPPSLKTRLKITIVPCYPSSL